MVIGLTGGVGCGKSTVLNYLEKAYHAYVIEADKVAKEIMNSENEVYYQIADVFPAAIDDGKINRDVLSDIVFNDSEKLSQLNAITHPGTIKEILQRIKKSENDIVVVESAILPGTGIEEYCDELWFVYCDFEIRIERLMKSRGYSREKCISMIKRQFSDEEYNACADEYIDNSDLEVKTREQIDMILRKVDC